MACYHYMVANVFNLQSQSLVIVVVLDVNTSVNEVSDEHLYVHGQKSKNGVEVVVDLGDEHNYGPGPHLSDDQFCSFLHWYHIQQTFHLKFLRGKCCSCMAGWIFCKFSKCSKRHSHILSVKGALIDTFLAWKNHIKLSIHTNYAMLRAISLKSHEEDNTLYSFF